MLAVYGNHVCSAEYVAWQAVVFNALYECDKLKRDPTITRVGKPYVCLERDNLTGDMGWAWRVVCDKVADA